MGESGFEGVWGIASVTMSSNCGAKVLHSWVAEGWHSASWFL